MAKKTQKQDEIAGVSKVNVGLPLNELIDWEVYDWKRDNCHTIPLGFCSVHPDYEGEIALTEQSIVERARKEGYQSPNDNGEDPLELFESDEKRLTAIVGDVSANEELLRQNEQIRYQVVKLRALKELRERYWEDPNRRGAPASYVAAGLVD